jgi:hypothetical protein
MQPARIKPHAKEHTNNPVQRPHFRGQGTKRKETPKDQKSPRPRRSIGEDRPERKPKAAVWPRCSRAMKSRGEGRRGKEAANSVARHRTSEEAPSHTAALALGQSRALTL